MDRFDENRKYCVTKALETFYVKSQDSNVKCKEGQLVERSNDREAEKKLKRRQKQRGNGHVNPK